MAEIKWKTQEEIEEEKNKPQPPTPEERLAELENAFLTLLLERQVKEVRSEMYGFLLNMWIMKKVDEAYLQIQVQRGRITQEEYEMIVATPQL